eukprot:scaffold168106_cov36-Tisochrysis_lutea.AAC.1
MPRCRDACFCERYTDPLRHGGSGQGALSGKLKEELRGRSESCLGADETLSQSDYKGYIAVADGTPPCEGGEAGMRMTHDA